MPPAVPASALLHDLHETSLPGYAPTPRKTPLQPAETDSKKPILKERKKSLFSICKIELRTQSVGGVAKYLGLFTAKHCHHTIASLLGHSLTKKNRLASEPTNNSQLTSLALMCSGSPLRRLLSRWETAGETRWRI